MTQNASWALQQSVYAALKASPALISRLGEDGIYDDIPRNVQYPYLSFGQSVVRDFSASKVRSSEHRFALHIWSRGKGQKEAFEIMDVINSVLHDQSLALSEHHLVNMRCLSSTVRRVVGSGSYQGILNYRVVTEQLG